MASSNSSHKNLRVAIYARVSTANHGQDVTLQTRELKQFAEARGWTIVADYRDTGTSGAKHSRPELNRLMIAARRRQFDVVLCWKLDRFGRSLRHLVNALAELEAMGVAFVSLTDNLDLSTPAGRLTFQVIAAMGEFERELIRERVRAGLRHARAKGKCLGRPRVVADGRLVSALRKTGHSWREICEQTGLSKGTAQRAYWAQKSVPSLPKTIAAIFLRTFETPFALHVRCPFRLLQRRDSPKII
jgi:DNA invertase Pin-like site-specific DNA recombinase